MSKFDSLPRINVGVDEFYQRRHRCRIGIRIAAVLLGLLVGGWSGYSQVKLGYFAIGSDRKHVPEVCKDQLEVVRKYLDVYPNPKEWTWWIACNEYSWKALASHLGIDQASGHTIFAETDRKHHLTYVRGYMLMHPPEHVAITPEHIVAHELAHAYLDSGDEERVDDLAKQWMKERSHPLYVQATKH